MLSGWSVGRSMSKLYNDRYIKTIKTFMNHYQFCQHKDRCDFYHPFFGEALSNQHGWNDHGSLIKMWFVVLQWYHQNDLSLDNWITTNNLYQSIKSLILRYSTWALRRYSWHLSLWVALLCLKRSPSCLHTCEAPNEPLERERMEARARFFWWSTSGWLVVDSGR